MYNYVGCDLHYTSENNTKGVKDCNIIFLIIYQGSY